MALCQVTSFSQSECFISAKCSHVMTNFLWHRLLERGPNKTEDQSAATHVSRITHIPEFNCWKWNVFLTGDLIKKLTGLKFFGKCPGSASASKIASSWCSPTEFCAALLEKRRIGELKIKLASAVVVAQLAMCSLRLPEVYTSNLDIGK